MRIPISTLINDGESKAAQPPPPRQKAPFLKLYDREYFFYNGRLHPFPWDESQRDLFDITHHLIYNCALGKRLHTVQLGNSPLHILDVGYGTGHWNLEMQRTYPSAEITGFDLVPFEVTPYVDTIRNMCPVDFTRESWPIPPDSQDLIHMALLCGNVPDWERMYRTVYKYLRPATGQIEHIELDFTPRSEPHPYPTSTSPASQMWWNLTTTASTRAGYPLALPHNTAQILEKVGFVDVSHHKIRIPFAGNTCDAYEQGLSNWFRAAMAQDSGANSYAGLSAFLLTSELGMSEGEVRKLCADVVREVNKRGTVLYCIFTPPGNLSDHKTSITHRPLHRRVASSTTHAYDCGMLFSLSPIPSDILS